MSVSLLDVNVLIALAWPSHLHHREAHTWFSKNAVHGWVTCPLTQCAFVRISSNPKIIAEAVTPREALALLDRIVAQKHHVFWADDIAVHDKYVPDTFLVGHRQVTDAYLLGLALQHGGQLVTLDKGVLSLTSAGSSQRSAVVVVAT